MYCTAIPWNGLGWGRLHCIVLFCTMVCYRSLHCIYFDIVTETCKVFLSKQIKTQMIDLLDVLAEETSAGTYSTRRPLSVMRLVIVYCQIGV